MWQTSRKSHWPYLCGRGLLPDKQTSDVNVCDSEYASTPSARHSRTQSRRPCKHSARITECDRFRLIHQSLEQYANFSLGPLYITQQSAPVKHNRGQERCVTRSRESSYSDFSHCATKWPQKWSSSANVWSRNTCYTPLRLRSNCTCSLAQESADRYERSWWRR